VLPAPEEIRICLPPNSRLQLTAIDGNGLEEGQQQPGTAAEGGEEEEREKERERGREGERERDREGEAQLGRWPSAINGLFKRFVYKLGLRDRLCPKTGPASSARLRNRTCLLSDRGRGFGARGVIIIDVVAKRRDESCRKPT
jgi:hypothetical protein